MDDKPQILISEVFEAFESAGVLRKGAPNLSLIGSMSRSEIFELADFLMMGFESRSALKSVSQFSHSASRSIFGRSKCEHFEHRLIDLLSCAQFSVLYSDRVYIHNFFSDYREDLKGRRTSDLRASIIDDIYLVLAIKPLMIKGYIELYVPEVHSCANCLEKALPAEMMVRVKKGYNQLSKEFLKNLSGTLTSFTRASYTIGIEAPTNYLEHALMTTGKKSHKTYGAIKEKPKLVEALKKNGRAKLPQSILKQLGPHKAFSADIAENVTTSIMTSKMRHSSFLTRSELEITFLGNVVNDEEIERRNTIAYKCLTSTIPFIDGISVQDLINLRSRERDAFAVYRSALNEAIKEFVTDKRGLSEKQANQLFSDVIEPKLARLTQKVNATRKELFSKGSRSVVAVGTVLTFGLYTGFLDPAILKALAAYAVGGVGVDLLKEVLPIGKSKLVAETDDLYFLWKVKELAS